MVIDHVARCVAITFQSVECGRVGDVPVPAGNQPLVRTLSAQKRDHLLVKRAHVVRQKLHLFSQPVALPRLLLDSGRSHTPGVIELYPPGSHIVGLLTAPPLCESLVE